MQIVYAKFEIKIMDNVDRLKKIIVKKLLIDL